MLLVAGYAAAVLLTIGAVYAVLIALLFESEASWWQADWFFGVAAVLGLIIVGGTLFKTITLAAGGAKVAAMLGARELSPETTDPDERRLLHIVEEMAIASGISPPPVFIVDTEDGINAFAAGFRPADAVIGVTRGCLRELSRDELQGVIAHEYSHILNGDMRLNIRLIGVLHGLLMIHLLGMILLRMMMFSGAGGRSRRRSSTGGRSDGRVAIVVVILGLAMMIIGAVGVFFGRLIKSAVSRQREYLADASAVQFTRYPAGLAGALKRIGGLSAGSRVRNPHAEEMSHLFFANGLGASWLGLMATHPPLIERIRRLDPSSNGDVRPGSEAPPSSPAQMTAGLAQAVAGHHGALASTPAMVVAPAAGHHAINMRPEELSASIGTLGAGHLQAARGMLAALPADLRERLHHPDDAVAAVLALLLSHQPETTTVQRKIIETAGGAWLERVDAMQSALSALDSSMRLAVIDLALPALQHMQPDTYRRFHQWCLDFVDADGEVSVFEYALLGMIERHLAPRFEGAKPPQVYYHVLKPLLPDAIVLLGVLAWFGNQTDADEAARVFKAGLRSLDPSLKAELPDRADGALTAFDQALKRFRRAALPLRQKMLHAGAVCVAANGRVTVDEGNLLRAVADAFDVPIPPLLASTVA